jgi:hypothetical protein
MLRLALPLVLATLLAACAPQSNAPHADTPRVVVEGDQFSEDVTVLGVQALDNPFLRADTEHWYLRSYVNRKTHTAVHQLYVELGYEGAFNGRYWAADDTAQPYPVELLYHERCWGPNCSKLDYLGIVIDEATLRANATRGMQVKISASSGYAVILEISAEMIGAQLSAEEQIMSGAVVVGQTGKSGDTILAAPTASSAASAASLPTTASPHHLGITYMKVPLSGEIMVVGVESNSPAEAAGLQPKDILLTFDGYSIRDPKDVEDLIMQAAPGSAVKIEILRDRRPMSLTAQM